ncbi:MAG: isopentenyl-diphosphate Delta-isomerase [Chitinophagaceae bacterium]|nr:isopentenyl-diphosphate Delta-isomerase [Chitinophagaceae bacterium]
MNNEVILVNEKDEPVGSMEKLRAHQEGLLHRAFSVFILNDAGEMLLQQRAQTKYHSAGLWTNACCSHPQPGEDTITSAVRRLQEELGFTTTLSPLFSFTYRSSFENGLIEHEYDHVFVGYHEGHINANPAEVMSVAYRSIEDIQQSLDSNPELYTTWFHIALPMMAEWLQQKMPASAGLIK